MQMDAKLPIDTFENVMQLAVEGCKAIANYIREVSDCLNMIEWPMHLNHVLMKSIYWHAS